MSDWDFLYEMSERGYSAEEIADAAVSGAAPWEWEYIDRTWVASQLENETDAHFKSRDGFPLCTLEQAEIFHDLIGCAIRHFENTGRYLQIWGSWGKSTLRSSSVFAVMGHTQPVLTEQLTESLLR